MRGSIRSPIRDVSCVLHVELPREPPHQVLSKFLAPGRHMTSLYGRRATAARRFCALLQVAVWDSVAAHAAAAARVA